MKFSDAKSFVLASVLIGIAMSTFGIFASTMIYFSTAVLGLAQTASVKEMDVTASDLFFTVVFAPAVETAILLVIFVGSLRWLKSPFRGFVVAATVFGFMSHFHRGVYALLAGIIFCAFAVQFIYIRNRTRLSLAYLSITLSHSVNNLVGWSLSALLVNL